MSVNNWTNWYNSEGILGLETKVGRSRKPIIDKVQVENKFLESINSNRQRLQTAKSEYLRQINLSVVAFT